MSVRLKIAYVDVPDTLTNIIRTGSGSKFRGIGSNGLVPLVLLQKPYGSREETGGNEIKEAGGDDQKELELR